MAEQDRIKIDPYYLKGVCLTTAVISVPALTGGLAWLYFLTPLPAIYFLTVLGFEKGFKILTHAAIISGCLALIFKALPILLFSLTLIPVGIILARGLSINEPVHRSAFLATLGLGFIWLTTGFLVGAANHSNLYSEVLNNIDTGLSAAYDSYSQSPDLPAGNQADLLEAFKRIQELIPRVFPGILIISTFFSTWSNMMLANWLLQKKGFPGWGNYQDWRLPENIVWLLIIAGASFFAPSKAFQTIGLNLLMVLSCIYFFQGLSVMGTLFTKWSLPKPIRFFIVFILIIQAYGVIILALLGVADIWAAFGQNNTENNQLN